MCQMSSMASDMASAGAQKNLAVDVSAMSLTSPNFQSGFAAKTFKKRNHPSKAPFIGLILGSPRGRIALVSPTLRDGVGKP